MLNQQCKFRVKSGDLGSVFRYQIARNQGFVVTLMGAGTRTQGVIICNQPRTVALKARGARKIELSPQVVIDEVLLRIAPLVT